MDDGLIRRSPCRIKGAGQERSPERPVLAVPEVYALADAVVAGIARSSHIVTYAASGDDGLVFTSSEGRPLRLSKFFSRRPAQGPVISERDRHNYLLPHDETTVMLGDSGTGADLRAALADVSPPDDVFSRDIAAAIALLDSEVGDPWADA